MAKVKQLVEILLDRGLDHDDELFEMANFDPEFTGLRFMVWFSCDPVVKHRRPRGKLRIEGQFYPFSLDEPFQWLSKVPPKVRAGDARRLAEFVRLNRGVLMDYWHGAISTPALVSGLKKLN